MFYMSNMLSAAGHFLQHNLHFSVHWINKPTKNVEIGIPLSAIAILLSLHGKDWYTHRFTVICHKTELKWNHSVVALT